MSSEPAKGAELECGCYAVAEPTTNRFGGGQTRWIRCPDHRGKTGRPDADQLAEHLADARHALAASKARKTETSDHST